MIPWADIFDEIDDPINIPVLESDKMISVYQFLVGRIDVWKDPFFLLKSKCPPTSPPSSIKTIESKCRYVCQPFPLAKIDSVSFERPQMTNLFVDKNGRLLQLLFKTESTQELKPWFEYIEVIEFFTWVWIFLARKPI